MGEATTEVPLREPLLEMQPGLQGFILKPD